MKLPPFLLSLILASGLCRAQNVQEVFERDFYQVSKAYIDRLDPYLRKFVTAQLTPVSATDSDSTINERNSTIEVKIKHYRFIATHFSESAHEILSSTLALTYKPDDKVQIVNLFQGGLGWEFLFLDYPYFKTIREELLPTPTVKVLPAQKN